MEGPGMTRAYLDTFDDGNPVALGDVEGAARAISLARMNGEHQEGARETHAVLVILLSGPPLLILRSVERGNGSEAWRNKNERFVSLKASN